ncbi:MAG: tetratricopeptide repeat protein [Bacteroidetes bacterium]|jgi:tetratricopeptide (TPR) repeat protein|nr:tetratricopeptide repeat protein [Bacteroidota bacterium]
MSRMAQLLEMLKSEPNDPFLNYALAVELAKLGQIDTSIDKLEALISGNPDYLGSYYMLGKIYEQALQPEKAIETYKKGIEIAKKLNDKKTLGELNEALLMLED